MPQTRPSARTGQSMLETCLAVFVIGLLFAGMTQVSLLVASREVLHHAAARGARAKTVGFNQWMVKKTVLIGAIPIAGKMLEPGFVNDDKRLWDRVANMKPGKLWDWTLGEAPSSQQVEVERMRIPEFLWSYNWARAQYILNYENWKELGLSLDSSTDLLVSDAWMECPLWLPMHRAFYDSDTVNLRGQSSIENHYPLYMDDENL